MATLTAFLSLSIARSHIALPQCGFFDRLGSFLPETAPLPLVGNARSRTMPGTGAFSASRADFLTHEGDVGYGESGHGQRQHDRQMRPYQQQALVEGQIAGNRTRYRGLRGDVDGAHVRLSKVEAASQYR